MRKKYREKPVTDLQKEEDAIDEFFDYTGHPKGNVAHWTPEPDELLEKKEFWKVFYQCSMLDNNHHIVHILCMQKHQDNLSR